MLFSESAFERQEESIRMFMGLATNRGIKEDSGNIKKILQFADDLKFDVESVMRIHAGIQSISPEQRKRIWYLHAKELGKVLVQAPKPFLNLDIRVPEPPEIDIKMCSAFTRLTGLEDKNTIYEAINIRHVLPNYVELKNYDPTPINRIANWLEEWSVTFFRKKDKALRLVKATELSVSTHYGSDCPNSPRLEYELLDIETGKPRYGFIYTKGKIIWSIGNLPLLEIFPMLKDLGWEN